MPLEKKYRKVTREPEPVLPYADPSFYLDDFKPVNFISTREDIQSILKKTKENERISEAIHPVGCTLGVELEQYRKLQRKSFFIVDNSNNIEHHLIYLMRRKLGKTRLASQFHFLRGKLFLVVDEFNRQPELLNQAIQTTLNGYLPKGQMKALIDGQAKVFMGPDENILITNYESGFKAIFFAKRIWLENQ